MNANAFEIRQFTGKADANGESDFLGPTSVLRNVTLVPGVLGAGIQVGKGVAFVPAEATETDLGGEKGFTISYWIYTDDPIGSSNFQINRNGQFYSGYTKGVFRGMFDRQCDVTTEVDPEKWHHVVWIGDPAQKRVSLWYDGNYRGSNPSSGRLSPGAGTLGLGMQIGDKDVPIPFGVWQGRLDEIRFYRRPLAVGEAGELQLSPPANFTVPDGVPVVKLESDRTPNRWMFAGPFFVDEYTAVLGADARPTVGQTVKYTKTDGEPATAAWRVLDPNFSTRDPKTARAKFDNSTHIIKADYAQALRNPRLTGGINFATASGRKYFTTCYGYTVLDVPKAGAYRAELIAGRIKGQDVYLAGQRIENETVVHLEAGRYPLLARVALAACGGWEPIEWAVQFRELHAGDTPPQPQPAARGPVTSFVVGAGLPVNLVGRWPLPDGPVEKAPDLSQFKPVPAEAFVAGKGAVDWESYNVPQSVASYGLSPKVLFGDDKAGRGLFYAVWDNRRSVIVELECPKGARFWLSGREVFDGETIRLAPGLYPLLLEVRAGESSAVLPNFRAVSDKQADTAAWMRRVRKNEALLRLIAGSGPQGAYAKAALDALPGSP